jgi:hypothetical protein
VLVNFARQGTFRGVAAEAGELSREVVAALRKRLLERKDEASECIQLLRRMGEPVEALQEDFLECRCDGAYSCISRPHSERALLRPQPCEGLVTNFAGNDPLMCRVFRVCIKSVLLFSVHVFNLFGTDA